MKCKIFYRTCIFDFFAIPIQSRMQRGNMQIFPFFHLHWKYLSCVLTVLNIGIVLRFSKPSTSSIHLMNKCKNGKLLVTESPISTKNVNERFKHSKNLEWIINIMNLIWKVHFHPSKSIGEQIYRKYSKYPTPSKISMTSSHH